MDIKDITGTGEAVKQIGKIAKKPISNIINPPTKTIGERLSDIVNLVFTPVELAKIYKDNAVEQFKDKLTKKVSIIPEDKKETPPLNVVGPAIEAAKYYIEDEVLQEMFANLIAGAMNSDTNNQAHPSFVEIIKQLSPYDAFFLEFISRESVRNEDIRNTIVNGIVYWVAELRAYKYPNGKMIGNGNSRLKLHSIPNGYSLLGQTMKDFGFKVEGDISAYETELSRASVSLDNLMRLNLVETLMQQPDKSIEMKFPKSVYIENFISNANSTVAKSEFDDHFDYKVECTLHYVKLTKFGISFCDIVMPNTSRFQVGDDNQ